MEKVKYYCGYEFNGDGSVKIHTRSEDHPKIDLYDKRPSQGSDKITLKTILPMVGSLSLMAHIFNIITQQDDLTDLYKIGGCVYLDELNNYHVKVLPLEDFDKFINQLGHDLVSSPDFAGFHIGLKIPNLDGLDLPEKVSFDKILGASMLSRNLDEYYINNESIVCVFE